MPRHPRAETAATDAIRIRVTPDEHRALTHAAKENGRSVAEMIREAVNTYVADYRDTPVFSESDRDS